MKIWNDSMGTLLLLAAFIVWTGSCSSMEKEDEEKWVDQSFHDISYRVSPSWEVIRTGDSVKYGRSGVEMNAIKIERFEKGETLPDSTFTVDLDREIWTYADEHVEGLRKKSDVLEVNRKSQNHFPPLGNAFSSMVVTKNMQGINKVNWFIGALIDQHYYLIVLKAERYSHLPAVKEAFTKFKSSLQLKSEKEEASGNRG